MATTKQAPRQSEAKSVSARVRELLELDVSRPAEDIEKILKREGYREKQPGKSFRQIIYNERSQARQRQAGQPSAKPKPTPAEAKAQTNGQHKPAAATTIVKCQFCGKECNHRGIKSHERTCPQNKANAPKSGGSPGGLAGAVLDAAEKAGVLPDQPAAAEDKQDEIPTTPLALAVRVRKLATQVGGLTHLESLTVLCKAHGPDKLHDAVTLCQAVGIERFTRLVNTVGEQQALGLCQAVGTEQFGEVVTTLNQIEQESASPPTDAGGVDNAQPPE